MSFKKTLVFFSLGLNALSILLFIALVNYAIVNGYGVADIKLKIKRLANSSGIYSRRIVPEELVSKYRLKTRAKDLLPDVSKFSFIHLGHTYPYKIFGLKRVQYSSFFNEINPDFVLHSGDLTYDPSRLDYWRDSFFEVFKGVKAPIYISPSNHESYDGYNNFRRLIRDEIWYSFNVGKYHFVVLAYNDHSETQNKWFLDEINNNKNVVVLLGGQDGYYQKIIGEIDHPNIKLVLAGDGLVYADSWIGKIRYLTSNDYFIRLITVDGDKISWQTYCMFEDYISSQFAFRYSEL